MNIWQFILVALPLVQLGGSLYKELISPEGKAQKKETGIGKFIGTIIWTCGLYYVLYRAGVLIIT